ncbi:MAG: hypothetical protein ACYDCN_11395 [Bacteroidia bacterium]
MKRNLLLYISLLLVSISFCCCKKQYEKTAKTTVQFSLAQPDTSNHVYFDAGSVYLSKVTFSGTRTQAGNVSFTDYPNKTISFSSYNGSVTLSYDIPQGTYSSITMAFELTKDNSGNGIILTGTYNRTDSVDEELPLQFSFNAGDVLSAAAVNTSGGSEITLSTTRTSAVQVVINPIFWFGTIAPNILDGATQSSVGGVSTIVVNAATNPTTYNNVVNRINQGTTVVFN